MLNSFSIPISQKKRAKKKNDFLFVQIFFVVLVCIYDDIYHKYDCVLIEILLAGVVKKIGFLASTY